MEKDLRVGEALELYREFEELAAESAPEDAQLVWQEVALDPATAPVLEVRELLGTAAVYLRAVEQSRGAIASPAVKAEPISNEQLLTEIYSSVEEKEIAQAQKKDIGATHELLEKYNESRGGKTLTKKETVANLRLLKALYKERWQDSELADQPVRLKQLLDSVLSKDGISSATRHDVAGFISERMADYVKETAATVSPDVLGERIKVCSQEGVSQNLLAPVLLKPYFSSVQGSNEDVVGENYERFVRGVLRTADNPVSCQFGLDIAAFKTKILEPSTRYTIMAHAAPYIRLDQPHLLARLMGSRRVLQTLEANMSGLDMNTLMERAKGTSLYANALDIAKLSVGEQLNTMSQLADGGSFKRLILFEADAAQRSIGSPEYKRRTEIMELSGEILSNPELLMRAALARIEKEATIDLKYYALDRPLDETLSILSQAFPGCEKFFREVYEGKSLAMDELPLFLPDVLSDLPTLIQDVSRSHYGATLEQLVGPEETVAMQTIHSYRRDGFVVEWHAGKATQLSDDEIADLDSLIDDELFQNVTSKLRGLNGMQRRHEVIVHQKYGLVSVIRHESEEDLKEFHPLEKIFNGLGDLEGVTDEDVPYLNLMIEENYRKLASERRRFLNDRGIETIVTEGDESAVEDMLVVEKHPSNPKAYVGTLKVGSQSACFLIDQSLRIQLGDRRVQSRLDLLVLNALTSELIAHFMTMPAVETDEGTIGEAKNSVTKRIAHLHMLPEGQHYSYDKWADCLEFEGEDLEVLSKQQAEKRGIDRRFTYYPAIEKDDPDLGPIRVRLPELE